MKAKELFLLLLIFLLLGCAATKNAFNQAKAEDTISSYENFLAKYPQSEFTAEANNRLEELKKIEAVRAAEIKATLSSYKIGHTTFMEFKKDMVAGSWETGNYYINETHLAEEGKSALEGKVL